MRLTPVTFWVLFAHVIVMTFRAYANSSQRLCDVLARPRSWLKPGRAEIENGGSQNRGRRKHDAGGVTTTLIFNTARHCTPTRVAYHKRVRRPSKVGHDRRQLAVSDAQTHIGEGQRACSDQTTLAEAARADSTGRALFKQI